MNTVGSKKFNFVTSNKGFTLIEIIVVVAIIAVMVSAIGFSMSNDSDRIARWEAKHFRALVGEARDEAIFTGQSLILSLDQKKNHYQISSGFKKESKATIYDHKLKPSVDLEWQVSQLVGAEDSELDDYVVLSSLGEITPFKASFSGNKIKFVVFVDEDNLLQLSETDR